MTKLCDIDQAAAQKLPPLAPDKSGIGVHYVDAFIKPMNTKLEDGTRVACKRKGLKLTLTVGTKKGEGLMRRLPLVVRVYADLDRDVYVRAGWPSAAGRCNGHLRRRL